MCNKLKFSFLFLLATLVQTTLQTAFILDASSRFACTNDPSAAAANISVRTRCKSGERILTYSSTQSCSKKAPRSVSPLIRRRVVWCKFLDGHRSTHMYSVRLLSPAHGQTGSQQGYWAGHEDCEETETTCVLYNITQRCCAVSCF